ncbi:MAG: ABC transporter permease [Desulfobacteraceae bacterium]|nr:ABC transporter permease [Desulfobacteraceae bacterium]
MAWRNVWRNPRRTWLTVSAIAFACIILIFMLSFQFGSYGTMINSAIQLNTGHLQIQAQNYFEDKSMRRVIPDPGPIMESVSEIESVQSVTARANAFSLVSSDNRTIGAMIIGIKPEREARVSTLETLVRKGRYLADADLDANPALIGKLMAQNLGVGLGEELVVLGQGRDGSVAATMLTVCGIYASGMDEFDRKTVHIPLDTFQDAYSMRGSVHEIVIKASGLDRVAAVQKAVEDRLKKMPDGSNLNVLDWDKLMPGLTQAIKLDLTIGIIFWGLLVLVVAFSILNTFLMAVFERTREFGVMMAIGTRPGRLVKIMLYESSAMTLVGVTLGIAVGCIVTWIFQIYGIDLSGASEILQQYGISGRIYPQLSVITAFAGPVLVWVVTITVSLYPALKIRKLKPVEAMTHV